MDARARLALEDVCRRALAAELDELYVRLEALERNAAASVPERREYVARRARAAADMRERGLTVEAIAQRLGVARATIQRDLDGAPASRKNGSRARA